MLELLLAVLAGVVTIAAPCTLPVLPILLGTALGNQSRVRPIFMALGFIATFATITLAFHFVTTLFGLDPDQLRNAAIALLAAFGLLLVWPGLYERLSPAVASVAGRITGHSRPADGALGGFLLGTTLGIVWTPCAGPVLGSILTLLATEADATKAGTLLLAYATGAAIPMLAIAYGGQFASQRVRSFAPYTHRVQQVFGVLVLTFAGLMYFQYDTIVTAWLTSFYPNGQIGL